MSNTYPVKLMSPLSIGGLRHTVWLADSGLMDDAFGDCDYATQRIRILDVLTDQKKRQILMHEILEALTSTHLIELTHEQLSAVSTEMLRVLDDNKHLREYLWGK